MFATSAPGSKFNGIALEGLDLELPNVVDAHVSGLERDNRLAFAAVLIIDFEVVGGLSPRHMYVQSFGTRCCFVTHPNKSSWCAQKMTNLVMSASGHEQRSSPCERLSGLSPTADVPAVIALLSFRPQAPIPHILTWQPEAPIFAVR